MTKPKAKPVTKNPNMSFPERRAFSVRLSEEELEKCKFIMTVYNIPDFSSTIRFLIHNECARLEGLENE